LIIHSASLPDKNLTFLLVICADCIGKYIPNYRHIEKSKEGLGEVATEWTRRIQTDAVHRG
jgi:hypothetical protein